jgi:hypothetical protein
VSPFALALLLLGASPGQGDARAASAAETAESPAAGEKRPQLLVDAGLAAAASALVAMAKPDIRHAIFEDGRFSNVVRNFKDPVGQVRLGTRRDSDPFWVNNVAHPGLFAVEGYFLKRRGYSDKGAFLFTQVHSVVWEFVIEGCAFEPSGKDLLADAAGAAIGIWVLHPLLGGGKGSKEGARNAEIAITPTLGAGAYGLRVHASF